MIVGIIGVETFYGRITGNFRVLDALATLAFDFPPGRKDRSVLFRSELEEFFVLCAREGTEPTAVKGSYAGAIGLAQFLPSSLNRYAVDMDGDGRIDLQRNAADAIGSVAHYFASFGWQARVTSWLAWTALRANTRVSVVTCRCITKCVMYALLILPVRRKAD